MRLSLIVTTAVLTVTVVFALVGYLIDLSARHNESKRNPDQHA